MFDRVADEALIRFVAKHGRLDLALRDAVERVARTNRVSAVEALCDGGWIDEATLVDLFQQQLRLPRVPLDAAGGDLPDVDYDLLRQRLAVPAAIDDGRLLLAMANPLDYDVIERLRFSSGLRIVPAVAPLGEIRAALLDTHGSLVVEDTDSGATTPAEVLRVEANDSPIVKMAAVLIEQAVLVRASDIHLEPTLDGLTVRYRIDGVLEEVNRLSATVRNPLIARFKVLARLDIAERRVPQDGGVTVTCAGRRIDCRVSTLPTQYGEKVVIRLLDAQRALVSLADLGLDPDELLRVRECLRQPEGMILTTGPTGSGKTTTLYAMLQAVRSPEVNIVTVENPIEYRLPGINQTEVNERQGMTFAAALRSILRQDPDVILVGEIRDRETAEIAVQAAQTGHLVLSTLHTNDAVGAITRLANLGVEPELLASTLLAVIAQRLVRRVCDSCGAPAPVAGDLPPAMRQALAGVATRRGVGCRACRGSGYSGRVGVYEIVRNSPELRRLIHAGASELDLRAVARRQGARALMDAAIEKIRLGLTSVEEVAQAVKAEQRQAQCPQCGEPLPGDGRDCPACAAAGRGAGSPLAEIVDVAAPLPTPSAPTTAARPTVLTITAPKILAVGSVLGAGIRAMCAAGGLDAVAASELELAVVEGCGLAADVDTSGDLRIENRDLGRGRGRLHQRRGTRLAVAAPERPAAGHRGPDQRGHQPRSARLHDPLVGRRGRLRAQRTGPTACG
ncbi:MAG: ATPase, T2SS/T4P/T4SS family [Candidatus Binatia bacterium]